MMGLTMSEIASELTSVEVVAMVRFQDWSGPGVPAITTSACDPYRTEDRVNRIMDGATNTA